VVDRVVSMHDALGSIPASKITSCWINDQPKIDWPRYGKCVPPQWQRPGQAR
jgi:hypothetical protein